MTHWNVWNATTTGSLQEVEMGGKGKRKVSVYGAAYKSYTLGKCPYFNGDGQDQS